MTSLRAAGRGSLRGAVQPLLRLAAQQAGLDGCLLVRQQGDRWVVLESSDPDVGVPVGTSLPWERTLCAAVLEGRAPSLCPRIEPASEAEAIAAALGLAMSAYVSLPLHDADGELLGSVCGWAAAPVDAGLLDRHEVLRTLADACAGLLAAELELSASRARADLHAPDADLGHHSGLLHAAAWRRQLAQHEQRCARLGATSSVLVVDLPAPADTPAVLLALLGALGDDDALTRLPSGAFALLLVDAGPDGARRRAAELAVALGRAGCRHRTGTASTEPGTSLTAALHRAEREVRRSAWQAAPVALPSLDPVQDLLDQVRRQLGQQVAFLSELTGDRQRFRAVAAPEGSSLAAGDDTSAAGSLCVRVLDGRLPQVMSDVAQHPAAREVGAVQAGLIGSYLAAPVRLSDGRLYGTLCCLSSVPTPGLSGRDAVVLQVVADALAVHVEAELEAGSEGRLLAVAMQNLAAAGGPIPVFQPVVATDGLGVVGVEALTRFPDGRSPLDWFLLAARHDVGVELELLAVDAALAALPALAEGGRFLAVNLSPAALAAPAVARTMADLGRRGLLGSLVVEITEHEAVEDYDALNRLLAPWRDAGLRLAVDDTGAGHSSLRHVLLLEPDIIKLDRELVTAVETDATRADLIASLVAFADRSGRALVAEGVETAAELACLTRLGVHLVQGFHLARPQVDVVTRIPAFAVPAPRSGSVHAVV
ncbi:MAG: diguanylate cyclase/phosphodiesterase with sensor [Frankiales bacterium]|nr:diguanylate cyclase/phosphodiesterase with sensor [Frankiales bacterium]